jgi:hypothetical protein
MRFARLRFLLLLVSGLVLLAGCGKHESESQAGESPEEATKTSLTLLHRGQFASFWQHALPPADYRHLRTDWTHPDPSLPPLTDADRAKFTDIMRKLTEPDAEKKLFTQIRPKLLQFDKEYRDQLPLLAGIFQSMAITAIDQAKDLNHVQKQQARDVLAVIAPWAQQVPWSDQDKARQAIAIVTDTARKLDVTTPDQLRTLDFDTSMVKYAVAWDGLKRLFTVYGLSLDECFDSATVETLEASDSSAHLRIHYMLLGKPLATEVTMIRVDGHWYDTDLLASVRESHARITAPAPLPAPASTVPVMASSPVAVAGSAAR